MNHAKIFMPIQAMVPIIEGEVSMEPGMQELLLFPGHLLPAEIHKISMHALLILSLIQSKMVIHAIKEGAERGRRLWRAYIFNTVML